MNISTFTRPISFALFSLAIFSFIAPITGPFQWALFGGVLFATGCIGFSRLTGIQASFTTGTIFIVGSLAALKVGNALMEAYLLGAAGFALITAAVLVAMTRVKTFVQQDVTQIRERITARPPMGEYLRARDIERKRNRPQPQWIKPSRETGFASVIGMSEFKAKLFKAGLECWGPNDSNGILLHGEPGDGKTMLAKALAGELGLEFVAIQTQSSQWVGQETEVLFNQLNEAVERGFCLIFFDEAETVLGTRQSADLGGKSTEMNALLNRLLTFIVDHRKSSVAFVAATNFLDRIDPAMRRQGRFDYVFEVPSPDFDARKGLLVEGLRKNSPRLNFSQEVLHSLAKRWDGFSAATILGVTKGAPVYAKEKKLQSLDFDDFMAVLRIQQGIACRVPETTKSFASMVYQPEQGRQIRNLIDRMKKAFEIEQAGGEAPSGVLFYGDAGTGKTETARMIAKETNWAFFPVSGSDLARNPDMISDLLRKVKNARPAMIFIDEADDLIGDRTTSLYKAATNKLLEAMDGVNGRVSDLLWIASTNFPEGSDAAVIRSGRFTEKLLFKRPEESTLIAHAKAFFQDAKRQAVMDVTWEEVGVVLAGCTIADAQGILMKAWNQTLTEGGSVNKANPVTLATLQGARQSVHGE